MKLRFIGSQILDFNTTHNMFSRYKRNSFISWNILHRNHSCDLKSKKHPSSGYCHWLNSICPTVQVPSMPILNKCQVFFENLCWLVYVGENDASWTPHLICTFKYFGSFNIQSTEAFTIEWFYNVETKKVRIS